VQALTGNLGSSDHGIGRSLPTTIRVARSAGNAEIIRRQIGSAGITPLRAVDTVAGT
jgi:hypothetical protein